MPLMPLIPAIAADEAITAPNNIAVVSLVNLRILNILLKDVVTKGCFH
jgi:hypothetical protein